jgi:hypothetical protein
VITNPYFERYASEKFLFKVVDQRLKVLQNFEVTLPFRDQDFAVESVVVSKAKTIYLLAKVNVPKKDRKDKEPNYYYEIVSLENGKAKEYELKLNDKYIDKVDVILDKKDNIKCFGFYADMQNNGKRKDGLNGIFYFSLTKNAIENINVKEFDLKLVADISGRRRANRDKGLEPNFNLKFFFDKPDGGAMVLAEEQFVQIVKRPGPGTEELPLLITIITTRSWLLISTLQARSSGTRTSLKNNTRLMTTASDLSMHCTSKARRTSCTTMRRPTQSQRLTRIK